MIPVTFKKNISHRQCTILKYFKIINAFSANLLAVWLRYIIFA